MSVVLRLSLPRPLSRQPGAGADRLESAERALGVSLVSRDDWVEIAGDAGAVSRAEAFFRLLETASGQGLAVRPGEYDTLLSDVAEGRHERWHALLDRPLVLRLKRASIVPKTLGQKAYLEAVRSHEITFGLGPAGTGKTYLAMACAVEALMEGRVRRLILTRPAVEAGEALGFLPGDLKEKILPYLIPLYDALHEMLGREETARLMEKNVIEVAPLAYMRGRTLADAFIVLDEAQNTTPEQMLMFLTRLGDNSRMVITGDPSQVDLPRSKKSGLREAAEALDGVRGVAMHRFAEGDVVRHPLVARIIKAYERHRAEHGA